MQTMHRLSMLVALSAIAMMFTVSPIQAEDQANPSDAASQSVAEQSTWGRIKVLYRHSNQDTAGMKLERSFERTSPAPMALTNQSTGILWPFGPSEYPSRWRGWDGTRTPGGSNSYCSGNCIGTHSCADYYSRDLSRTDGSSKYKAVYVGRPSYVLSIRKGSNVDCYGNSVIVWDPRDNVQIRYSHLWSVSTWITEGMWIAQGKLIGWVGNTGCNVSNPHLHLTAYKGIPPGANGIPPAGNICSPDKYACQVYFYSGPVYP